MGCNMCINQSLLNTGQKKGKIGDNGTYIKALWYVHIRQGTRVADELHFGK
jgi:hypothetical protein